MAITKKIIFICAIIFYSYMSAKSNGSAFIHLYGGIPYDSLLIYYLIDFFLFACYSLYIYNEFETYIHDYGAFIILREKSRLRLFLRLIKMLVSSVLFLEALKITIYTFTLYIIHGSIQWPIASIFIQNIVMYLLPLFIILLYQMILELYVSGKVALLLTFLFYLSNTSISSIIYLAKPQLQINLFWLPNYMMMDRRSLLIREFKLSNFTLITIFILSILLTTSIAQHYFAKKDIY